VKIYLLGVGMSQKFSHDDLKRLVYEEFTIQYAKQLTQYSAMMIKMLNLQVIGKGAPLRYLRQMRGLSIQLEKFGKNFRERTIELEKQKQKQ
jgi:hypothetical protein